MDVVYVLYPGLETVSHVSPSSPGASLLAVFREAEWKSVVSRLAQPILLQGFHSKQTNNAFCMGGWFRLGFKL